jgi:hypothetical protein
MAETNNIDQMIAIAKCMRSGIYVEPVAQSSGRYPKCKIQVTKADKVTLGQQTYDQRNGELNDKIIELYTHYAKQLKQ